MHIAKFRAACTRALSFALGCALLCVGSRTFAAEKLVGLQSAPSVAMALPWFAEEARLYSKYDLDFQLVYIAHRVFGNRHCGDERRQRQCRHRRR